jgi:hypothetical protein
VLKTHVRSSTNRTVPAMAPAATSTASSPSALSAVSTTPTAPVVITSPIPVTAVLSSWRRSPIRPSTAKVTLPLALVPVTVVSTEASTFATVAGNTVRNSR